MDENAILELINRRQRQILVHSFIYYQLNDNIVPDHVFDEWVRELSHLMKKYKEIAKKSECYKDFKYFDGSTGFDLPYTHTFSHI